MGQARRMLDDGLTCARAKRERAVKIIHGYGSTGKGGAIKSDVGALLAGYKRTGRIKDYCAGEDFEPFSENGRRIAQEYPELRRDKDYTRGNQGITIVLLR